MEAIIQRNKDGKPTLVQETIDKPHPESHQALIAITHIAQNPTDVQSFDSNAMGDGSVFGCDFSGVVESIGDNVTRVEPGDKIAGLIWGGK
jgi:NADPH:quinone reductase-like Zn-dependent oxidoreductase